MNLGQLKRQIEQAEATHGRPAPVMPYRELAKRSARLLKLARDNPQNTWLQKFAKAFAAYIRRCLTIRQADNYDQDPELAALLREKFLPKESVEDLI